VSFGRPYEQPERAIVARNQRARVPLAETARQLGRGKAGVRSYASDNGLLQPRDPWTDEQRATAFRMRDQGRTSREIGEALGKTASNVRKMFWRRRGVPAWEASGQLGHRVGGTTEIYAKFDPAYLGQARHRALSNILAAPHERLIP
jgi:hypothetical protein